MNNTAKAVGGTIAAVLVIGGTVIYQQLSNIADEPTGPGSGDEITVDEPAAPEDGQTGPGSGDELPDDYVEPAAPEEGQTGPGSGDELPDDYVEPTGPGSGDELPDDEPSTAADEPTGPGSGDELPDDYTEPTGPGSGDELPDDYVEPTTPEDGQTGPGSGDELPDDYVEPTTPEDGQAGPGSGDEINAVGSCNVIAFGSTCVDYIGSYWSNIDFAKMNCSGEGTWSSDPCPQPTMGGCNTNAGQTTEMIIWHYNYGGDPFDAELAGYAAMACDINPYGTWIGQ